MRKGTERQRRPEGVTGSHPDATGPDDLVEQIMRAQQGSREARERLVTAFVPFVLKVAQQVCRRRLRLCRDDEVSVAMVAFMEAVERYRPHRGGSFTAFARMVVQHRVIDSLRRSGVRAEVPVSCFSVAPLAETVDLNLRAAEMRQAMLAYQTAFGAIERREELLTYRAMLRQHGISLAQVVRGCPRHADARARAIAAARAVADDPGWRAHLLGRRALPLKEMVARGELGVSRTTLERHRRYIVAVALLFCLREAAAPNPARAAVGVP